MKGGGGDWAELQATSDGWKHRTGMDEETDAAPEGWRRRKIRLKERFRIRKEDLIESDSSILFNGTEAGIRRQRDRRFN